MFENHKVVELLIAQGKNDKAEKIIENAAIGSADRIIEKYRKSENKNLLSDEELTKLREELIHEELLKYRKSSTPTEIAADVDQSDIDAPIAAATDKVKPFTEQESLLCDSIERFVRVQVDNLYDQSRDVFRSVYIDKENLGVQDSWREEYEQFSGLLDNGNFIPKIEEISISCTAQGKLEVIQSNDSNFLIQTPYKNFDDISRLKPSVVNLKFEGKKGFFTRGTHAPERITFGDSMGGSKVACLDSAFVNGDIKKRIQSWLSDLDVKELTEEEFELYEKFVISDFGLRSWAEVSSKIRSAISLLDQWRSGIRYDILALDFAIASLEHDIGQMETLREPDFESKIKDVSDFCLSEIGRFSSYMSDVLNNDIAKSRSALETELLGETIDHLEIVGDGSIDKGLLGFRLREELTKQVSTSLKKDFETFSEKIESKFDALWEADIYPNVVQNLVPLDFDQETKPEKIIVPVSKDAAKEIFDETFRTLDGLESDANLYGEIEKGGLWDRVKKMLPRIFAPLAPVIAIGMLFGISVKTMIKDEFEFSGGDAAFAIVLILTLFTFFAFYEIKKDMRLNKEAFLKKAKLALLDRFDKATDSSLKAYFKTFEQNLKTSLSDVLRRLRGHLNVKHHIINEEFDRRLVSVVEHKDMVKGQREMLLGLAIAIDDAEKALKKQNGNLVKVFESRLKALRPSGGK